MEGDRLSQGRQWTSICTVPPFKYTYQSPITILIRKLDQPLSHPLVLELCDPCVSHIMEMVLLMSIEAGRHKYQVRLEQLEPRQHFLLEYLPPGRSLALARLDSYIEDATWPYIILNNGGIL